MNTFKSTSIEQAVKIVETFSQPAWIESSANPDVLLSELQSIRRWAELTARRPYHELVRLLH